MAVNNSEKTIPPQGTIPEADAQQPSKRDAFRSRLSKRYPDLNMDDDDAVYDKLNSMADEHEGYEQNTRRLRESMSNSPIMQDMLLAARDKDGFDPVEYLLLERGLDLKALLEDPDMANKIAENRAVYLEKQAKSKEIEASVKENMPKSIENIIAKAEELGLTDDQVSEIVGKMYQQADDMMHGIIDPEHFALLAKGSNYDSAMEDARAEGKAEGLNTKVDDKLRTLANKQEYSAGTQTPQKNTPPERAPRNMFLDGDEDLDY